MVDERIRKAARILVEDSVKVKKGETIRVSFGHEAREMAMEIFKLILKKGAYPLMRPYVQGFDYLYYKNANKEQLKHFPDIAMYEAKNVQGLISIATDVNTRELSNIDPKKISMRKKVTYLIQEQYIEKTRWVGFDFPTNALAQEADMSLEEFEDFVYSSTIVDWKKEAKRMKKVKDILDKGNNVRILGEDTDLSFSIKGRTSSIGDGSHNMPDGEVFLAPVETSTEGKIAFSFPAIYGGRMVEGVKLEFKKGRITKAKADKNENFLRQMINTDKGSKYLGEFGIGCNYNIKKFVRNILFDEKIGGTVHLAIGSAYKEGGGKNESAVHWDIIKDLRKKGEILVDDKVIQKNGKFKFKF